MKNDKGIMGKHYSDFARALGSLGGKSTSEAKKAAARKNGALGGRNKKAKVA